MNFLPRPQFLAELHEVLEHRRIAAILGPRQCGKTTLAREVVGPNATNYFDCERPSDRARLEAEPELLADLKGTVVIDEIQQIPDLFPVLRHLADRRPLPAKFMILGSASPDLRNRVSETLAGRVGFVDLGGFDCTEVGWEHENPLWLRGGFPEAFLSETDEQSFQWRRDFIRTFVERDIPQFGLKIPAESIRRFWTMLAHVHGQTWNSSAISKSLGVSDKTTRDYRDILEQTFMVRTLKPFFTNTKKRLVKSPKVYLRDTGILHALLGLQTMKDLYGHPGMGFSWEGFAIEQILRIFRVDPEDVYFWRTQAGAELDLFFNHKGRRLGFEFKRNSAPTTSRSMRIALEDLELDHLFVVYPGHRELPLAEKITAVPLRNLEHRATVKTM